MQNPGKILSDSTATFLCFGYFTLLPLSLTSKLTRFNSIDSSTAIWCSIRASRRTTIGCHSSRSPFCTISSQSSDAPCSGNCRTRTRLCGSSATTSVTLCTCSTCSSTLEQVRPSRHFRSQLDFELGKQRTPRLVPLNVSLVFLFCRTPLTCKCACFIRPRTQTN
jgi:hypothetical protein